MTLSAIFSKCRSANLIESRLIVWAAQAGMRNAVWAVGMWKGRCGDVEGGGVATVNSLMTRAPSSFCLSANGQNGT